MFRVLSYPLRPDDPVWPGNPPPVRAEAFQAIANGDVVNTTVLHLFSHSGTHLDAPKHFNEYGPAAIDLPIEAYIFFAPAVVTVPKPQGGLIVPAEIEQYAEKISAADIVFLYTGWSAVRSRDPHRYATRGPALHPDTARVFIDEFPTLRAVAIDAVSIGSPQHEQEAIETHQILTGVGREDGRFLLIFEDLRIDPDLDNAVRIYAWPLFIEGSDGSPCTMVAEFPS